MGQHFRHKRYVFVDDATGLIKYARSETRGDAKSICHLQEITDIQLAHNMWNTKEIKCFILTYKSRASVTDDEQITFTADDREMARFWVDQLTIRAKTPI